MIIKLYKNLVFLGFGAIADFISKVVNNDSPGTNQHIITRRPIRSRLIGETNIKILNNLDEFLDFDLAGTTCTIISWKSLSDFKVSDFDLYSKKFFSNDNNLLSDNYLFTIVTISYFS